MRNPVLLLPLALTVLTACTQAAEPAASTPRGAEVEASTAAEASALYGSAPAMSPGSGARKGVINQAGEGACARLSASEAEANSSGMIRMGKVTDDLSFFGRGKEVLCSEPGASGAGECELVPNAIVKVEQGGERSGLKAGPAGALLRYAPTGVTCGPPLG